MSFPRLGSVVDMFETAFCAGISLTFAEEYGNPDEVIAFCLYLVNKIRWNCTKIR